jgi:hypothetical protein
MVIGSSVFFFLLSLSILRTHTQRTPLSLSRVRFPPLVHSFYDSLPFFLLYADDLGQFTQLTVPFPPPR